MAVVQNNAYEAVKQTVETTTLPAGVTVSGLTFMGYSLSDWVFVGTGILLAANLFLTLPKVFSSIRSMFKKKE